MPEMTKEEYKEFLLQGTKTGKLATVREDGRPHVVPIWYGLDGDNLVFTTGESSIKAKNMKRDPRVSISIDDQTPPYSFVTIEGTISFSKDPEEMLYWATRIGGRYMGEDKAEAFGKRNASEGEVLVTVKPVKIIAFKDVTAW
ncbi:MAG: PPOX class F420-dependent oxidoreductase [Deltaproteobacteria bacterium]|nr:PPOX class F420-dependent oxidoreductase [Deltaproteobacteria bacterium]